jgi:hypothetical protein
MTKIRDGKKLVMLSRARQRPCRSTHAAGAQRQMRYNRSMRPEILYPLFAPVTALKGVGPKVAPLVERLAGPIVRDLLFLGPQALVFRPATTAGAAREGEVQTLLVAIDAHIPPPKRDLPYKIRAFDGTGFIALAWFKGGGPHLARQHPVGARRAWRRPYPISSTPVYSTPEVPPC